MAANQQVLKEAIYGLILATLIVLLLEMAARSFLPFPTGTRHTYIADPYVLYFHRPLSVGYEVSPYGEFPPVRLVYNQFGFRGDWEQIPQGKPLVAVLGDSYVEARQVSEQDSVTGRLAAQFPDQFFINAGCSAYTTTTEYLLLKHRVLSRKPSRLLLFFTFNDYSDNFIYQGGYYRHDNLFSVAAPPDELKSRDFDQPQSRSLLEELKSKSALAANLARLIPQSPAPVPSAEKPVFQKSFRGVNTPTDKLDRDGLQVLAFTHRGLLEIARIAHQSAIPFTVFIIPLPTQVSASEWSPGKTLFYGYPPEMETTRIYQDRLLSFCKENGIECIDLLPDFQQALRSGSSKLFFDYDGHWTAMGHNVVAKSAARVFEATRQ